MKINSFLIYDRKKGLPRFIPDIDEHSSHEKLAEENSQIFLNECKEIFIEKLN